MEDYLTDSSVSTTVDDEEWEDLKIFMNNDKQNLKSEIIRLNEMSSEINLNLKNRNTTKKNNMKTLNSSDKYEMSFDCNTQSAVGLEMDALETQKDSKFNKDLCLNPYGIFI